MFGQIRFWSSIAGALACGAFSQAVPEISDPGPTLLIHVYNHTEMSETQWSRARSIATKLFRRADLPVQWKDCPLGEDDANGRTLCHQMLATPRVVLRIMTKRHTLALRRPASEFGFAALPAGEVLGELAYIFHGRVASLSKSTQIDLPILLGHVVAHEIGHLLLGSKSHSVSGVMTKNWTKPVLRLAEQGHLGFSPQQSRRMKHNLQIRAAMAVAQAAILQ